MDSPPLTCAPLLGEPLPVELMNTIWADPHGGHDELTDRAGLRRWLGAVAGRSEVEDLNLGALRGLSALTAFRALRDALRILAAQATGDTRPIAGHPSSTLRSAVSEVNRASALAPSWPELTWTAGGRSQRSRAKAASLQIALSRIAAEAVHLLSDGTQLRACYGPGCVLYFVRSHPRREWCGAACGNRARVARHYARHRPSPRGS